VNGYAVPPFANLSRQVSFTSTAHENSNFDKVVLRQLHVSDLFVPVVIAITNSQPPVAGHENPSGWRGQLAGAFVGPVETFQSVLNKMQGQYPIDLCHAVDAANGEYLDQLRLPYLERDKIEFPLGWTLSSTTATEIDKRLNTLKSKNDGDFNRIRELLNGKASIRSVRKCT